MSVQIYSLEDRRARSRELLALHDGWVDQQLADGLDGPTPPGRRNPSDYNQHVPDLEASGEALDGFWSAAEAVLRRAAQ